MRAPASATSAIPCARCCWLAAMCAPLPAFEGPASCAGGAPAPARATCRPAIAAHAVQLLPEAISHVVRCSSLLPQGRALQLKILGDLPQLLPRPLQRVLRRLQPRRPPAGAAACRPSWPPWPSLWHPATPAGRPARPGCCLHAPCCKALQLSAQLVDFGRPAERLPSGSGAAPWR
jgi:hypothetical protein